jgi:ferric-dicitrate binding protein FerR (iron transport regulator)
MMNDTSRHDIPDDLEARLADLPNDEAEELRAVWQLLHPSASVPDLDPDPDRAWGRIEAHIQADSSPSPQGDRAAIEHGRHAAAGRTVRMVAGLLVAALVAGALFWQQPVEVAAPPGAQRTVSLPDGSTAHLNSGSTLHYQRGFAVLPLWAADERAVTLRGEAFFEVQAAGRPFVVETRNARVDVLGTTFNVKARPTQGGDRTEVTLVEGRVRLASRADRTAAVTLTSGEAAWIEAGAPPTAPRDTSVERLLAWRSGGFSVIDQPVRTVVDALERRYGTRIEVDSGVPADSITLYYRSQTDVETILGDMCEALHLQYTRTSQGYVLSRIDER